MYTILCIRFVCVKYKFFVDFLVAYKSTTVYVMALQFMIDLLDMPKGTITKYYEV